MLLEGMSRLGLKWLENRLKPKDCAKDTDWVLPSFPSRLIQYEIESRL